MKNSKSTAKETLFVMVRLFFALPLCLGVLVVDVLLYQQAAPGVLHGIL
jgi:hypothetical protein